MVIRLASIYSRFYIIILLSVFHRCFKHSTVSLITFFIGSTNSSNNLVVLVVITISCSSDIILVDRILLLNEITRVLEEKLGAQRDVISIAWNGGLLVLSQSWSVLQLCLRWVLSQCAKSRASKWSSCLSIIIFLNDWFHSVISYKLIVILTVLLWI